MLLARGKAVGVLRHLLARVTSPQDILGLSLEAASALAEDADGLLSDLLPSLQTPSHAPGLDAQKKRAEGASVRAIAFGEAEYPRLLQDATDPPAVLLARGQTLPDRPCVAIVGSRRASRAGLEAARQIAFDLSRAGVVVASGFARGIDAAAHRAALDADASTTAVFGCGADVCYPPEQKDLLADLLKRGTVLSEFPLGTEPRPFHFPIRNRVIAGLSRIVLVVEAAEKSGSLITARLATDYGRDVAAVPGLITTPHAAGSNSLLKDGAIFVRSAEDLLAELPESDAPRLKRSAPLPSGGPARGASTAPLPPLDPDALAVFAALDPDDPRDADSLIGRTRLSPSRFSAAMLALEMEGLVLSHPGALFSRPRRGA